MSAQRPHPDSDLSVAVAAQVGEQMGLDLIAQVSARERQQWAFSSLRLGAVLRDVDAVQGDASFKSDR